MNINMRTFTRDESEPIKSVLHTSNVMIIEFRAGNVYRADTVPVGYYEDLVGSESKGRYFNDTLKRSFDWVRVLSAPKKQ